MKHIGLFEGIGGFSLAARWMGWETVAICENDKKCQQVLAKHFPTAKLIDDVRDIYRFAHEYEDVYGDGEVMYCQRHGADFSDCDCIGCSEFDDEIGEIDVLTAGFPCQPFSNNGKREGKNDERNLWPETIRIIQHTRPKWFVGENVPGIISWNNGEIFAEIISDLEREGYEVWTFNIPATSVGAEHKRERIWFVANDKSQRVQRVRANRKQQPCPLGEPLLPLRNSNGEWQVEPDLRRVNDGVPAKMDRLKQVGNAIVPQVALQIFKAIQEYENLTI